MYDLSLELEPKQQKVTTTQPDSKTEVKNK